MRPLALCVSLNRIISTDSGLAKRGLVDAERSKLTDRKTDRPKDSFTPATLRAARQRPRTSTRSGSW